MAASLTQKARLEALEDAVLKLAAAVSAAPQQTVQETPSPATPAPSVPFLSCWSSGSATRTKVGKTFAASSKRHGKREYLVLSEDEAIQILRENLAAGRVYAVPA